MARIIVVDDEKDIVILVSTILRGVGHEVIGSTNGYEALEILKKIKPDLILLDIMMPEIDGWEVLKMIREIEGLRSVPVAMLTAVSLTPRTVEKEEMSELIDYIEKPFDKESLIKKVNFNIIEDLERISQNKSKLSLMTEDKKKVTAYEIAARLEKLHKNILSTLRVGLDKMEGSIDADELNEAISSQEKAIELFRRKREGIEREVRDKFITREKAILDACEIYSALDKSF